MNSCAEYSAEENTAFFDQCLRLFLLALDLRQTGRALRLDGSRLIVLPQIMKKCDRCISFFQYWSAATCHILENFWIFATTALHPIERDSVIVGGGWHFLTRHRYFCDRLITTGEFAFIRLFATGSFRPRRALILGGRFNLYVHHLWLRHDRVHDNQWNDQLWAGALLA